MNEDLSEASKAVFPIFAQAHFFVSRQGKITQVLTFYYHDEKYFYRGLQDHPDLLKDELKTISSNMDRFFTEEKNILNGERVSPEVTHVDLFFHGSAIFPAILMFVEFQGQIKSGRNLYESWTEQEILEYGCLATWTFPFGARILKIVSPLQYDIFSHVIVFKGGKGDLVGGREKIYFQMP
ncbi:MAG: hypothetical protein ACTSRW_00100 [Candidatus Helarchaeota archaeon]